MDHDRRSQWLRGVLDLCVLALLAERESYGYQLSQALEKAGIGSVQGGTLYPVLLRLQRTGLVVARWREGESGPARKYYRITPVGSETLRHHSRDWQTFTGQVDDLLRLGDSALSRAAGVRDGAAGVRDQIVGGLNHAAGVSGGAAGPREEVGDR